MPRTRFRGRGRKATHGDDDARERLGPADDVDAPREEALDDGGDYRAHDRHAEPGVVEAGERADLVDEARGEFILRYYQAMGTGSTALCAYRLHSHLPSTPALPVR